MRGQHSAGLSEKKAKKLPGLLLIIFDLILTGLVLCVFALFHHVLPQAQGLPEPVERVLQTSEPAPEYNDEKTPDPGPLSWREKFAEHFSAEPLLGEGSYKSPDVSITITEHSFTDSSPALTYYVADIYIAQIENFQTSFAVEQSAGSAESIARENQAIVAINGDYCTNQRTGFLVRNGLLYLTEQTSCDICVLYYDGTMATYGPEDYLVDELLELEPYQVWKFGPALLESDGSPKSQFNTGSNILNAHPRSGLGYYEPGHYCFVVVDGRQSGYSDGIDMAGFAGIFSELGCVSAYNMDGGASASMVFNGETASRPCNGGRYVSDILLIRELEGEEK